MADSLSDLAVELYTGPLADFVASRNAQAAATTDRALAARIRALKKPSVAAWVVNVFAREREAQLGEALQLARELREAQDDLDARALAQLGRDRRALTNRLAAAAVELAEARGERITSSTRDAVQQTITAAFFDPAAAAAVASGRLIRELEPSGTFAEIADTVVGGDAPAAPEMPAESVDEVGERRRRRDAERALRDAEKAHERAARDAASADRALRDVALRIEELEQRERDLEVELASVRNDAKRVRTELEHAGEEQERRAERVSQTESDVRKAQTDVSGLTRG